jgi:hypothetical protein
MPDQCLNVHPVPRTKGQPRSKLGREPLGLLADAIGTGSISPLNKLVGMAVARAWIVDVGFGVHYGLKWDIAPCPKSTTFGLIHRSNRRSYSIIESYRDQITVLYSNRPCGCR